MVEVLGLSSFPRWRPLNAPDLASSFRTGHAGYGDSPTLEPQP